MSLTMLNEIDVVNNTFLRQTSNIRKREQNQLSAGKGFPMGPMSRRNMLQMMGAAAFAGPLLSASRAFAAREGELNILCWEGYNSAQVLDPFRSAKSATVKAEVR